MRTTGFLVLSIITSEADNAMKPNIPFKLELVSLSE